MTVFQLQILCNFTTRIHLSCYLILFVQFWITKCNMLNITITYCVKVKDHFRFKMLNLLMI